jgi:protein O-mannosyl-transferase
MWRSTIIFLFTCLLYANTLQNGFVLGDENVILHQENTIETPTKLEEAFSLYSTQTEQIIRNIYGPITSFSYRLDHAFWNQNPFGYHLTNVLLFGLLCLVLLLFLGRLQWLHPNLNLLLVLLFAAHPIHTETVAHVSNRYEILSFLFLGSALWSYDRFFDKKLRFYMLLSAIFSSIALLIKETNLLLLVLMPMLAFYRKQPLKAIFRSSWWIILLLFLIPLYHFNFSFSYCIKVLSPMENQLLAASNSEIWATKLGLWGKYLQLLFIPYPLRFDYSFNTIPLLHWNSSEIWTLICFVVLALAAMLAAWRKQSDDGFKILFAFLFFVIGLFLTSNPFITLPHFFAEHFVFIPSFGFLLIIFLVIQTFSWNEKAVTKRIWLVAISVCVLLASAITVVRNQDWKSNESLFTADIKHLKNNAKAHALLAAIYFEKGEQAQNNAEKRTYFESAITQLEESNAILETEENYLFLAELYLKTGRTEGAIKAQEALEKMRENGF